SARSRRAPPTPARRTRSEEEPAAARARWAPRARRRRAPSTAAARSSRARAPRSRRRSSCVGASALSDPFGGVRNLALGGVDDDDARVAVEADEPVAGDGAQAGEHGRRARSDAKDAGLPPQVVVQRHEIADWRDAAADGFDTEGVAEHGDRPVTSARERKDK